MGFFFPEIPAGAPLLSHFHQMLGAKGLLFLALCATADALQLWYIDEPTWGQTAGCYIRWDNISNQIGMPPAYYGNPDLRLDFFTETWWNMPEGGETFDLPAGRPIWTKVITKPSTYILSNLTLATDLHYKLGYLSAADAPRWGEHECGGWRCSSCDLCWTVGDVECCHHCCCRQRRGGRRTTSLPYPCPHVPHPHHMQCSLSPRKAASI